MSPQVANAEAAHAGVPHIEEIERDLRRGVPAVEKQHRPIPTLPRQRLSKLLTVCVRASGVWKPRYLCRW